MSNLTRPQLLVLKKLASHFKISAKKLLQEVDDFSLTQGGLYIGLLNEQFGFNHTFACVAGKFNLGEVLNERKFLKSDLYQAYLSEESVTDKMAYCSKGTVWVVYPGLSVVAGEGVIVTNYTGVGYLSIQPLKTYLEINHPLPSE